MLGLVSNSVVLGVKQNLELRICVVEAKSIIKHHESYFLSSRTKRVLRVMYGVSECAPSLNFGETETIGDMAWGKHQF